MSLTKLGNFLEDDVKVILKKDADFSYFTKNGYCDYRCGCDVCMKGDARGFKTNILDIISDSKEWFLLKKLDLDIKNSWCEKEDSIYLQMYYETSNIDAIKDIHKYYIKINELWDNDTLNNSYDTYNILDKEYPFSSAKIASNFSSESIENIKNVKLCSSCYTWFICLNEKYSNDFAMTNLFKYFWIDVVNNYLCDITDFKLDI
jgi:hypothetical protein